MVKKVKRVQNGNRIAVKSKKVLWMLLEFSFSWEHRRAASWGAPEMVGKAEIIFI